MNDTDQVRMPEFEIRLNPGIERSPLAEIKQIRTLLDDVYKDAGDGRTLIRELVQNADDARARHLRFFLLDNGLIDAKNSLLRGAALLVVNDGKFHKKDHNALHQSIGGSKESDVDKIGTFGIGLKSVFHICESFLYIGVHDSNWHPGVLNPWVVPGETGENYKDLHNPDWSSLERVDVEKLIEIATMLLEQKEKINGFLLWIPLRCSMHLNRGENGLNFGIGDYCPEPNDIYLWFKDSTSAVLQLAQCGYLQSIETNRVVSPDYLHECGNLRSVTRQTNGWVGRHQDDEKTNSPRIFKDKICSEKSSWQVVGIDALGNAKLRELRNHSKWPSIQVQGKDGKVVTKPRKALAHAAVTVLRPESTSPKPLGTRLRWAVFLALDDDPAPISSSIVVGNNQSDGWEIILHGYFWPSQDRRSIPGVTDDLNNSDSNKNNQDMRIRWNRALSEELLLPLLPEALSNAVDDVDKRAALKLIDTVSKFDVIEEHMYSVTQRHWLLPTVDSKGIKWNLLKAKECPVISIPRWGFAPKLIREQFVLDCDKCAVDVVFIDNDSPRLAGELTDWSVELLKILLNSIPDKEFGSPKSLSWIGTFVSHVIGTENTAGDTRAAVITQWLVEKIGNGVLARTTDHSSEKNLKKKLRKAWRNLCERLPKSWLLHTPIDSQLAVGKLSKEKIFGAGLFPVPFGIRQGVPVSSPQFDQARLDCALTTLGKLLGEGHQSKRMQNSCLLLAETLLSNRNEDLPMSDELLNLPLLRATRLAKEKQEAWSISELRRYNKNHRVFASSISNTSSQNVVRENEEVGIPDSKMAVLELSEALNKKFWYVYGDAIASFANLPLPTPGALAASVNRSQRFAKPKKRKNLIARLIKSVKDCEICLAVRALLVGHPTKEMKNVEIFYSHDKYEQLLHELLLLRNQSWRAVEADLIESVPPEYFNKLSVKKAVVDEILKMMLDHASPWIFAKKITELIFPTAGLPPFTGSSETRELLKSSCWLPGRDGKGVAPNSLLIVPEEIQTALKFSLRSVHLVIRHSLVLSIQNFGKKQIGWLTICVDVLIVLDNCSK